MSSIQLDGLTGTLGKGVAPRELECLMGVAIGLSNKEVARQMGVTEGSIKKRLICLGYKLGSAKRAGIVAAAFRAGIIAFAGCSQPEPQDSQEQQNDGVLVA